MRYLILGIILSWILFWVSYLIQALNSGRIYYRYKKSCTSKEKPVLYKAEMVISVFWVFTGYAALFWFLRLSI